MFDLERFASSLAETRMEAYNTGAEFYHGLLTDEVDRIRMDIVNAAKMGASRYRVFSEHVQTKALRVYCEVNRMDYVEVDDDGDVWFVWHRETDSVPSITAQIADEEQPDSLRPVQDDTALLDVLSPTIDKN